MREAIFEGKQRTFLGFFRAGFCNYKKNPPVQMLREIEAVPANP
jgi:hypothetical protein